MQTGTAAWRPLVLSILGIIGIIDPQLTRHFDIAVCYARSISIPRCPCLPIHNLAFLVNMLLQLLLLVVVVWRDLRKCPNRKTNKNVAGVQGDGDEDRECGLREIEE